MICRFFVLIILWHREASTFYVQCPVQIVIGNCRTFDLYFTNRKVYVYLLKVLNEKHSQEPKIHKMILVAFWMNISLSFSYFQIHSFEKNVFFFLLLFFALLRLFSHTFILFSNFVAFQFVWIFSTKCKLVLGFRCRVMWFYMPKEENYGSVIGMKAKQKVRLKMNEHDIRIK